MLLESHLRLTMSILCCFSLDVLRLTGAAATTERSITTESALDAVYRFLRSSSTPPTATSASTASATSPMMLRSTWLRQRGCTLVASLITIHSRRSIRAILVQRKNIAIWNFSNGTLLFNYSCILLKGMKQNIHLDLLFKILCMKTRPSALVAE